MLLNTNYNYSKSIKPESYPIATFQGIIKKKEKKQTTGLGNITGHRALILQQMNLRKFEGWRIIL